MDDSGAVDDPGSATAPPRVPCPHCGAWIDDRRARPSGRLWRLGCPDCGLQLVRRPDGDWAGIRG